MAEEAFWPNTLGNYVFLESLKTVNQSVYKMAKTGLSFNSNLSDPKYGSSFLQERVGPAIDLLKKIQASEYAKEQGAIKSYTKKLEAFMKQNIPEELKESLREQLEELRNNNFSGDASARLIHQINILSQDLANYRRRIKQLTPTKTKIKKQQILERMQYDIVPSIENFLFDIYREDREKNKISQTLEDNFQRMIEKKLKLNNMPQPLYQALIAALYADFRIFLANNNLLDDKSFQEFSKEKNIEGQLEKFLKQYEEKIDSEYLKTHFQKLLADENQRTQLLQNVSRFFLREITHEEYNAATEIVNTDLNKLNEQQQKKIRKLIPKAKQTIKQYETRDIKKQNEDRLVVRVHNKSAHGNFFQILNQILRTAINVESNIGADLIVPVATVSIALKNKENPQINLQQTLKSLAAKIGHEYSLAFDTQTTITLNNLESKIEEERKLNGKVSEKLKGTAKKIDDIKAMGGAFISHESLKLYSSSEINSGSGRQFHGRTMNIGSALVKLQSMSYGKKNQMRTNELIPIILNIHADTVGAQNKKPLETYLSLFAGILMFDDVGLIAQQALKKTAKNLSQVRVNTSAINQLHVYNVGGTFYPLSVILNNIIQQVEACSQEVLNLSTKKTATATIHPPKSITPPETYTESDWNSLADTVFQGTTIQIAFLSGFMDYINKLSAAMNLQG